MAEIPYHQELESGEVLSLSFANPDRDVVEDHRNRQKRDSSEDASFLWNIHHHPLEEQVYSLYTAEVFNRTFPSADEVGVGSRNQILVDTVIDIFRGVEKQCREDGNELAWYKQPNLIDLAEAINQTNWRQPVPRVAGSLLSNLIFKHALPNANHRSSLGFVQVYLSTFAPEFEIPDTGETGEWYDWSEQFVRKSKKYLMLSRKADLFRYLHNWGCEGVVRKNGMEVSLGATRIDQADPHSYYRQEHRDLCIEFVYEILERTDYNTLIGKADPGRSVFMDRLAGN